MKNIFWFIYLIYILLFFIKVFLSLKYYKKNNIKLNIGNDYEKQFSIVQPILSGDKSLETNLIENIKNIRKAEFIWLIDKSDLTAKEIIKKISKEYPNEYKRVKVIEIEEIEQGYNPKIYKINYALPYFKKYGVVLDDDTVIMPNGLESAYKILNEKDGLVTGIPYYKNDGTFFSKLVTGFVNSNSIFTYFTIAELEYPKTINGMFYIFQTETAKKLEAFKKIEKKLCDDYEMAKIYINNSLPIFQTVTPCMVFTEVKESNHYFKIMKRWMVFANRFFEKNMNINKLIFILIPSILPTVIIMTSFIAGIEYIVLFLLTHIIKAMLTKMIRKYILKNEETKLAFIFEIIADYMVVLHYLHSIVSPNKIQWRSRILNIKNDGLRYED